MNIPHESLTKNTVSLWHISVHCETIFIYIPHLNFCCFGLPTFHIEWRACKRHLTGYHQILTYNTIFQSEFINAEDGGILSFKFNFFVFSVQWIQMNNQDNFFFYHLCFLHKYCLPLGTYNTNILYAIFIFIFCIDIVLLYITI